MTLLNFTSLSDKIKIRFEYQLIKHWRLTSDYTNVVQYLSNTKVHTVRWYAFTHSMIATGFGTKVSNSSTNTLCIK